MAANFKQLIEQVSKQLSSNNTKTLAASRLPAFLAWSLLLTAALVCGHALAAAKEKEADKHVDTDSIISTISASERTRPFPIGEKLAYFVNIKDGDQVRSPFRVAFAVTGMGVSPVAAGDIHGTGHHHILIDMPMPVDIKAPIPFDKPNEYQHQHYKHFGNGETETLLDLPAGKHTLRLLFADHSHVPYYISSKEISVVVLDKPH
ncbi:MAG: hypothetical protein JWQ61_1296 [Collimonas fungivorans]|uniref:DUF4399 domain-containing protein n=1 Tax=Collimonas fungivorans TaxID=158899 RepID=UPI0026F3390D|nr:DUF4399 domain-containing protein [Collimonas fungivorans]MDB5766482.1 hypothetical protein [Collimonas fungivorans]